MKDNSLTSTPLKKHAHYLLMMLSGALIFNAAFLVYIAPNNMLASGVWGVSAILNHFFSAVPIGVFLLIINTPLIIWGWSKLQLRFAVYTVIVILVQSNALILMEPFLPIYTENPLLACIFGGVFMGVGSGLVVRFHGSGGGMDIVGIILRSKFDIGVGTVMLSANIVIVGIAAFIFGAEPAMYTLVSQFVFSRVFGMVLEGGNRKRNMMIISEKGPEVAESLIHKVGRGVTMLKGEGAYTQRSKDVLFCVVGRFELVAIKEIIAEVDPQAFVCINETYEVMGRFSPKATDNLQALAAGGIKPKVQKAEQDSEDAS